MMFDLIKKKEKSFTRILRKVASQTTQRTTDDKLIEIIRDMS